MNDHEQHIKDWYARLCALLRQASLYVGETACSNCGRPRKEHHYEKLRCTLYLTSTEYVAVNHKEIKKTEDTVAALEHLAAVCGWNLP